MKQRPIRSEKTMKKLGCTEEDGCVVNYGGGREYWCPHADQDKQRFIVYACHKTVIVPCSKIEREVVAVA